MRLISFFLLISSVLHAQFTPSVDSVSMRDGKKLAADIYSASTGTPAPTILIQTPYNRQAYRLIGLPLFRFNPSRPYTFVIIDWRCFYGSSSACVAQPKRGEDGYDVVQWIVSQSWSNGKVGTWGPSALGKIQYQTAREHPAGLVCAVPLVAGSQFDYQEYFPGGAARTEYIEQLDALGFGLSSVLYANPVYNNVWSFAENENYYPDEIEVPMLLIGGWYDHNVDVMIDLFDGLKTLSPVSVRDQHRLLMGPWTHGGFGPAQVGSGQQGELSYPEAAGWSDSLALEFLDYHLRGIQNGWDNSPVVQHFQMGENAWNNSNEFPPAGLIFDTLSLQENNSLSFTTPAANSSYSSLTYDPRNPSPTYGGATLRQDLLQGPYDQSDVVESRNDILIFTTETFQQDVKLIGKTYVKLFVSADRLDTDFTVRLTDVYPDGKSMLLLEGVQRMRFRDGYTTNDTSAITPGAVYPVTIPLPWTCNTFLQGHRLRLDITSSNYPRFDLNLNNGGTMYAAGDTLTANNSIYHNANYPSFIAFQTNRISGIGEELTFSSINIMPNPADDFMKISFDIPLPEDAVVTLFNPAGAKVFEGKILSGQNHSSIALFNLPVGLYLLQIYAGSHAVFEKIVVSR